MTDLMIRAVTGKKIVVINGLKENQRFKADANGELYHAIEKTTKRPGFI